MDSRLNDGSPALTPPATNGQGLQDWAEAAVRQKWGNSVLGSGNTGYNTRLNALRGTPTETSLITGPYVRLAGLDPSVPLDDSSIARSSPLRGNFAQFWLDMNRERQHLIAERGSCALEAPEPSSIGAWATLMNTKFPLAGSDPATFDEGADGDTSGCCDADPGNGRVATIVITSHGPRRLQDPTPYNHYSLLQSFQRAFGLGCLENTCDTTNVTPMLPLFNVQ
jgi:hypothetical protein